MLRDGLKKFIEEFKNLDGEFKYKRQLQKIANLESVTFKLNLNDIISFESDFKEAIKKETKRFLVNLYSVCDKIMPEPASVFALEHLDNDTRLSKRIRLQEQLLRERQIRESEQAEENEGNTERVSVPSALLRRYSIQLIPEKTTLSEPLRNLGARQLGGLVSVKGIVTKVTTVKLQLVVAAYICNECGHEVYNEANESKFNPVVYCPVPTCLSTRVKSKKLPLIMNNRRSKFRKYQEISLQELPEDTPVGHIPQLMKVEAMHECTQECKGGDTVTITGIMLAEKIDSFEARISGRGESLPFVLASSINRDSKTLQEINSNINHELDATIDKLSLDSKIYEKLANSLAPEIFGMLDVKKALLLQLVSGSLQQLDDGLKLRGDVNICMVGDPGVAKSQLLKAVSRMSPRAVYTTGKGSSAVGLTACVSKDKYSGEVILEPGALVLADNGICCIDEFDKMSENDRTAIHEVMEQQTVSIAKAGVTTTLNARTSVLAAANPVLGRYNRKLTPSENMDLPAALLSRFDLIFILLDIPSEERDSKLAKYVTDTHLPEVSKTNMVDENDEVVEFLDIDTVRAYISQAKSIQPTIPSDLIPIIVEEYVTMRQDDKKFAEKAKKREQLTPRQLLSLLRLSHAIAKIRMDNQVTRQDVQEAMRLIRATKSDLESTQKGYNMSSEKLFHLLQRFVDEKVKYSQETKMDDSEEDTIAIDMTELESFALSQGANTGLLESTINSYENLQVWRKNEEGTKLLVPR